MPTPTPARRLPPPPRIRTVAARTSLATARRASTRGRAAPTDRTRPRDRPGHRVAALLEAIIPPTSPTLPAVCQAAPLTAISPTVSKLPTDLRHLDRAASIFRPWSNGTTDPFFLFFSRSIETLRRRAFSFCLLVSFLQRCTVVAVFSAPRKRSGSQPFEPRFRPFHSPSHIRVLLEI